MPDTKIVIVTPLYPPDLGRPSGYIKEFAARASSHYAVTVMTYGSFPEKIPGVRIASVSKNWPIPLRMIAFTLRLWREARKADVLWVCDGASVGSPSVLVARLRGIPVIRHVLMDEAWERETQNGAGLKVRFVRALQTWVLRQARRIVVPTKALQESCLRFVPSSRTTIIASPPDRLQTVPFPVERSRSKLLAIGPFSSSDDLRMSVVSISRLAPSFPEIHLTIANEGPWTDEITRLAIDAGIADRVTCLGFVSRVEMSFLLQSCGVLILGPGPSNLHQDIFSAYEARIPVIATDDRHHQEAIRQDVSGLLVPQGDPDALVRAVTNVMADSGVCDRLVAGGERELREKVGWDAHMEAFQHVVNHAASYGTN